MANRYWVGDSGTYTDTAHWAASSGGANGQSAPTSADDVFFDANSFTMAAQVVTTSGVLNSDICHNLDFTGALHSPTLACVTGTEFIIYGSVTLIPTLTIDNFGALFLFLPDAGGITINSAGCVWPDVEIGLPQGTLVNVTLASNLTSTANVQIQAGINFDGDGFTIDCPAGSFNIGQAYWPNAVSNVTVNCLYFNSVGSGSPVGQQLLTNVVITATSNPDYRSITYTTVTGSTALGPHIPFIAGIGSVNGGGNVNWVFAGVYALIQDMDDHLTTGATYEISIETTSAGRTAGDELITNGGFTGNMDGWTIQDSNPGWTYDSNNILFTSNGGNDSIITQEIGVVSARTYVVEFDTSSSTTVNGYVQLGAGDAVFFSTIGHQTLSVVCGNSNFEIWISGQVGTASFHLTNVSVKALGGESPNSLTAYYGGQVMIGTD